MKSDVIIISNDGQEWMKRLLADEVKVSIEGWQVEMVIFKKA